VKIGGHSPGQAERCPGNIADARPGTTQTHGLEQRRRTAWKAMIRGVMQAVIQAVIQGVLRAMLREGVGALYTKPVFLYTMQE